ncbi:DUF2188 domain-containing protein [Candidatus Dojkabacteria bacterium]|nr:DUF2188 domain-containing protein [Candidatus Dojkabacteria bacterium]
MKKVPYKTNQNNPQIKEYKNTVEKVRRSYHFLPVDNGWVVKYANSNSKIKTFTTQKESREFAKDIAKNSGVSLFIHSKNGTISDRLDFGI